MAMYECLKRHAGLAERYSELRHDVLSVVDTVSEMILDDPSFSQDREQLWIAAHEKLIRMDAKGDMRHFGLTRSICFDAYFREAQGRSVITVKFKGCDGGGHESFVVSGASIKDRAPSERGYS